MQTKINSFIESSINTAIGYILSILIWIYVIPIILPELAPHSNLDTAFIITLIFTVASILRNYYIRRLFNYIF